MAVVWRGVPRLASTAFEGRLDQLKLRSTVLEGHDGLRERELRKMETLVDAIAKAFRQRGVDDLTADVVAETAVGVVKVSLRRWVASDGGMPLASILTEALWRVGDAFTEVPPGG